MEPYNLTHGILKDDPRAVVVTVLNVPVDGQTRINLARRLVEFLCDFRFRIQGGGKKDGDADDSENAVGVFTGNKKKAVRAFDRGSRVAVYDRQNTRSLWHYLSCSLELRISGVKDNVLHVGWRRFGMVGAWADAYSPECVDEWDYGLSKKCHGCKRRRPGPIHSKLADMVTLGGPECDLCRSFYYCDVDIGERPKAWDGEERWTPGNAASALDVKEKAVGGTSFKGIGDKGICDADIGDDEDEEDDEDGGDGE